MKKFCTPFLLFAQIVTGYAQEDYLTTEPVLVADEYGNHHPQIEMTNDNRVNVSWTSSTAAAAYFAKHNGVDGFNPPIQLNPVGLGVASYTWSGPDFAIEGSNVYAVFRADNFQSYLVKSTDHGVTFGDTVRIASEPALFPFYPDVAVHHDTVYVTFMNHLDDAGTSPNYVLARSIDGGETFENFVLASDLMSDEVCDCCPPEILVNDNYVVIFFRNNDDNIRDIKAVVSTDRGETFTDWINVDEHEWMIMSCPSTGPDARWINENEAVSVYKSSVESEGKIFVSKVNLPTAELMSTQEIYASSGAGVASNYPQIASDDGLLGVVWESLGDGTSVDVFFNTSPSEVMNFDPDKAINLTQINGVQSKPDITLKNGVFHVVYANSIDGNLYYLQVAQPNSIQETDQLSQYQVYPTQFNDQFFISVPETTQVSIFNTQGKLIDTKQIKVTEVVNTTTWSAGFYIIQFDVEGAIISHKVVKY